MKTRIITGLIMTLVLLPLVLPAVSASVAMVILFSLLSGIGTGELLHCLGVVKKYIVSVPLIAFSAGAPFVARYGGEGRFLAYLCAVGFCLFFLTLSVSIWSHGAFKGDVGATAVMMTLYIAGGLSAAVLLRDMRDGYFLFFLIFIGAWITDIFAYFCGMLFGKHKLNREVSPKKTVEGSVGGTLFTVLMYLIYGFIVGQYQHLSIPLWTFAVLGIAGAVIAQLGDLLMSLFKREYGIKDYGKLLPGHGGILDRFDSIISIAPFLYILCRLFMK